MRGYAGRVAQPGSGVPEDRRAVGFGLSFINHSGASSCHNDSHRTAEIMLATKRTSQSRLTSHLRRRRRLFFSNVTADFWTAGLEDGPAC
jgi:hypothetical protein